MYSRRSLLKAAGAGLGGAMLGISPLGALAADTVDLPFANGQRRLAKYPGKRPMIVLTERPPQLETPFSVFNENIITPNDAFFVRYHLAGIPLDIDPETYTLSVQGKVNTPLKISLQQLKTEFDAVELVAAHQCSGNSRAFFEPRVGGGQAGNGLMGNARWKGVPLKAILEKAGVQDGAVQVSFNGLDAPLVDATPDFVKALDVNHALGGEVMVAYAMNGEDLPWLNGFPVRLIVPGYYGTYWVKHLSEITVLDHVLDDFWMSTAYRIPNNPCACIEPGAKAASTIPINRFAVRSFITSVVDGDKVAAGDLALRGFAFDGGYGITEVGISSDGGQSWTSAKLGDDLGKYSFREWKTSIRLAPGEHTLLVRATNSIGQSQPMSALWNPSGYMRHVVETTRVHAA